MKYIFPVALRHCCTVVPYSPFSYQTDLEMKISAFRAPMLAATISKQALMTALKFIGSCVSSEMEGFLVSGCEIKAS
jgi:hypothetical protein